MLNFEDYNVETTCSSTQQLLVRCKDQAGNEIWDTNKWGEFWCFVARVILTPKDLKNVFDIREIRFESEPFLIADLTQSRFDFFCAKVQEQTKEFFDKTTSIRQPSKLLVINL